MDILLAEDEEHIAKLVQYKLSKDGFKVHIAKNGIDAIEQLEAQPWVLIILDVMMPICDGWQVLEKIRMTGKKTPVLMLTAKRYQKDIAKASELGATQFLGKPFDPSDLSSCVKKLIEE